MSGLPVHLTLTKEQREVIAARKVLCECGGVEEGVFCDSRCPAEWI